MLRGGASRNAVVSVDQINRSPGFIQPTAFLASSASTLLLVPSSNNFAAHCSHLSSKVVSSSVHHQLPRNSVKVWAAARRRRIHDKSDTYVLLEPGEDEAFVSEDELKAKLKSYLENRSLPPDLARFEDVEDAVSFLVGSACELQMDGDVGSLQWYQVRLDA